MPQLDFTLIFYFQFLQYIFYFILFYFILFILSSRWEFHLKLSTFLQRILASIKGKSLIRFFFRDRFKKTPIVLYKFFVRRLVLWILL